jgi:hypothetical protein
MGTTCPGAGYYPGITSHEKSEVVTLSDPCSGICEFRLCLGDDGRLIPCAGDETAPDVVVRAPFLTAHATGRSLPFVLKHERQRLTLICQLSPAPCSQCTTADECFTGGSCEAGYCEATALCQ